MPECEGCHKDVKRITMYSKTAQCLGETCLADLEKPPAWVPPASSTEDGELSAVLFNDNETCEIVAPASGVLISLTYDEGDTVTSEAVPAKIETDR